MLTEARATTPKQTLFEIVLYSDTKISSSSLTAAFRFWRPVCPWFHFDRVLVPVRASGYKIKDLLSYISYILVDGSCWESEHVEVIHRFSIKNRGKWDLHVHTVRG